MRPCAGRFALSTTAPVVTAKVRAAIPLAMAGETDRAAALLDEVERQPGQARGEGCPHLRFVARAMIDTSRGQPVRTFQQPWPHSQKPPDSTT